MNTKNILNQAYIHWLNDGIFEIGFGILLAGVGALRAIIHLTRENPVAYYLLSVGLLFFMIGIAWVSKRVGEALKVRITYPRIGFMAFRPHTYNLKRILAWLVLLILTGVLGVVVGVLATQPNQKEIGGVVPITQGIVGALAFIFAAQRFEIKRYYYLAAIAIGLGLAIGALGVGVVLGLSFFYLSTGLVMIMSGALTLVLFLRGHEPISLNGMNS